MIISRTPFRISFFGGGTDYPVWYRENGGVVLNTTIDKYCYISCRYLPPFFDYKYRIRYSLREEKCDITQIKHPAVRECLKFMRIDQGIEMVHTSDLPARSGIGSSSAFTVGFLNALNALAGRMIGKRQLAANAIYVEQDVVGESVGSQDQVAAAFGGLNRIEFNGKENFLVQPVTVNRRRITELQNHLMFFFTGFSRTASEIVDEQLQNTAAKSTELKNMREMVDEAVSILNNGADIEGFGKLMDESWRLKRSLSSRVSTDTIDTMYETALKAGAIGGKLCGAGGGGFMLLFVPPRKQRHVQKALNNLLHVPFSFETLGSQIIVYAHQDSY
ncbi:MAG: GHMP family kinase ATP-binding protein [Planctomycetota bacterium]|jgi:D-glycero-alpha-D-manno-heptose-7-phosphate kinase